MFWIRVCNVFFSTYSFLIIRFFKNMYGEYAESKENLNPLYSIQIWFWCIPYNDFE